MRLFFYGTLMDADIRAAVMGTFSGEIEPATARGWRRVGVAGRPYPTLVAHSGGRVDGLCVSEVGGRAMRNLLAYEGPEYRLEPILIRLQCGTDVEAATFLCRPGARSFPTIWRFGDWLRRHKSASLARIGLNGRAFP